MLKSMILSKSNLKLSLITLSWMTAWCLSTPAFAGIVLNGTRVVYPAQQSEVTVTMKNTGKMPVLAQSWIDNGNQTMTPDKITTPFILTPPINRIDTGKGQTLRISLADKHALPQDKESVFYLNVLEIPAKLKGAAEENHISVAFRTRVKMFYRPENLKGSVDDAPDAIQWTIKSSGVTASNHSSYYQTLGTITYTAGGAKNSVEGEMLAPGETRAFRFKNIASVNSLSSITFTTINDYGAVVNHKVAQ
jgi:chaperone protein EcpD